MELLDQIQQLQRADHQIAAQRATDQTIRAVRQATHPITPLAAHPITPLAAQRAADQADHPIAPLVAQRAADQADHRQTQHLW